jgi:PHD/YefM family antitoxin component YafN of YafNO toxin-antitoxin module
VHHHFEVIRMMFMTMRELLSSTQKINEYLASDGSLVVTNNGKPAYVMIEVNEDSFEDTMLNLKKLNASKATAQIQKKAAAQGLDELTIDEIDAEIKAARRERT